ncbi:MAG TPA: THUMP domain-containing protein [bacterium]|jgi:putative N6-adenine-specific DNA methylase|nr:THUMP domain-containing protein [bacterium]HNW15718.1 THUMP domain-containing protein [bacterium]HNZ54205.1 THUMP domain-containing protein [bacterium]HPG36377.1 THUMP domain-containing protein [bacterium]HPM46564.1 THUMP domain-containing protein [bacterium]
MTFNFFATCPRGLEVPLINELSEISAADIKKDDGGVHFSGDISVCYKANLFVRTAGRVYWKVSSSEYRNEQDIYDLAYLIPWHKWFDVSRTIRVSMVGIRCPLKSLNFAGLKIKDAICDRFRKECGSRPDVDPNNPDIRIHGFVTEKELVISIDTSGDTLFKRGFREETNAAPIRENLAAGILYLAGWKPGIPLLDPMCGSGTFLIEAAQMSLNIAPGISRKFAFEKFKDFDRDLWLKICEKAVEEELDVTELPIFGSDISADAVEMAKTNLNNAGLLEAVTLNCSDILDISAPADNGLIVANLPYGERMGEINELRDLYPKIGDTLKKNFSGWNAYLLSSDLQMPKFIRLSVSKRTPLFNGQLECRLFEYKMVSGSNRSKKDQ